MTEEARLIAKAARGDREAFESLVRSRQERVFWTAFQVVGDEDDARDVAQQVFIRLWKVLPRYRPRWRFDSWLYRITVNAARDLHRKRAASGRLNETYAELTDLARGEAAQTATEIAWLYECLDRLAEPTRETAVLVLAEGMSHKQAAEVLEVKESTVSWRMHELKKQLKAFAEEEAQA